MGNVYARLVSQGPHNPTVETIYLLTHILSLGPSGWENRLNNHPLLRGFMSFDFSSEFQLEFFHANGFIRRICPKCGRAFWSQGDWPTCGESPCEEYSFIGQSPIKHPYSVHEMREEYLSFFEENRHGRVRRYPIVARWRDDVFFTQASIYDFQPWVLDGVIEPHNPLTISQTCVRFNDIDNVGRTGRHYTFLRCWPTTRSTGQVKRSISRIARWSSVIGS